MHFCWLLNYLNCNSGIYSSTSYTLMIYIQAVWLPICLVIWGTQTSHDCETTLEHPFENTFKIRFISISDPNPIEPSLLWPSMLWLYLSLKPGLSHDLFVHWSSVLALLVAFRSYCENLCSSNSSAFCLWYFVSSDKHRSVITLGQKLEIYSLIVIKQWTL